MKLFETPELYAREMSTADVPQLQALFDANPGYFRAVNGRDALPDEAQQEFDERPPASLSWSRMWFLALCDDADRMSGTVVLAQDLCTAGAWHITLLWLPEAWQGRGVGGRVFAALERWAQHGGARWLRLVYATANTGAAAFWRRQGFQPLRLQCGVDTGGRLNDLQVACKPLGQASLEEYLQRVPRDLPGPAAG